MLFDTWMPRGVCTSQKSLVLDQLNYISKTHYIFQSLWGAMLTDSQCFLFASRSASCRSTGLLRPCPKHLRGLYRGRVTSAFRAHQTAVACWSKLGRGHDVTVRFAYHLLRPNRPTESLLGESGLRMLSIPAGNVNRKVVNGKRLTLNLSDPSIAITGTFNHRGSRR